MERNEIGKKTLGRGAGRTGFGRAKTEDNIKQQMERANARIERMRDKARQSLLSSRRRLKDIVKENEEKMMKRKAIQPRNLNPTAFSTMPPKAREKLRRGAVLSTVPAKPRYSRAEEHKERVYGQRFEKYEPDSSLFYGRRDLKQEIQGKLEEAKAPALKAAKKAKPSRKPR